MRLFLALLAIVGMSVGWPGPAAGQSCGAGTTPGITFDAPFDFTGPGRSMPRHTRSPDAFRTWGWSCDDPNDEFPLTQRCQVWDTCSVGGPCSANVASPSPFVTLLDDADCGTASSDPTAVVHGFDVAEPDYLPDHRYFYTARCNDADGNACLVSFPFWYDTTAPVVAIDPLATPAAPPNGGATTASTAHFEFHCTDNSKDYDFLGAPAPVATATCSLFRDDALVVAEECATNLAVDGSENGSVDYMALEPGPYRFEVTCTDPAIDFDATGIVHPGNQSAPATWSWTVEGASVPLDPYLVFKVKPTKEPANALPKDANLTIDDALLPNDDPDDPENVTLLKAVGLALPSEAGEPYAVLRIKGAREGAGEALPSGTFPKATKHVKRRVSLANALGDVVVATKKPKTLWVPASIGGAGGPPADAPHFLCYDVKPTLDVTAQTPDNGKGKGKFRKDVQSTSGDDFTREDCALDRDGSPSFPGAAAAGLCLYDLKKPKMLCHPAATAAVTPPRGTTLSIVPSVPDTTEALLCYLAKIAPKIRGLEGSDATSLPVDTKIRQSKHAKRAGAPTTPGNGFPSPVEVDTKKPDLLCLPSTVVSIEPE